MSLIDKFEDKTFVECLNIMGEELKNNSLNYLSNDDEVKELVKAVVSLVAFIFSNTPPENHKKIFQDFLEDSPPSQLSLDQLGELMLSQNVETSITALFGVASKINKAVPLHELSPQLREYYQASFGG